MTFNNNNNMWRWTTSTAACCAFLCLACFSPITTSKEIEVGKEWTVVGENDTIPAGVHVRMDMTTGEKFVKLIDDDDDEPSAVSMDAQGNVQDESSSTSLMVQETPKEEKNKREPNYDFEMMHRTLSKLPREELERIGGLPPVEDTDRLKEIWTQRQQELQALHDAEDGLANLPQVLKDRIASLSSYLENPTNHLESLQLDNIEELHNDNVVSVLLDLEYHLSDIDMARDFHTLGGWPFLVSLLDDTVHYKNTTQQQQQDETNYKNKIQAIQAHAAWAIGTMVKNTPEFYPYAIEKVSTSGDTVLSLLVKHFDKDHLNVISREALYQKVLYALGALLRGNRMAQEYFVTTLHGPQILSSAFEEIMQQECDESSCLKLTKRIMLLAHDVVSDVLLHPHETPTAATDEMDKAIVESFTTSQWCDGILSVLEQTDDGNSRHVEQLHTAALVAIQDLTPYCKSTWNTKEVKRILQGVQSSWNDNDEIQELVDATMLALAKNSRDGSKE